MNSNLLFTTLTLRSIITIFFFLIVVRISNCDNDDEQYFSDCGRPYSDHCGSSVLNIFYPFWGGKRPQSCGREGFEIKCQDDQYHFIDCGTQKFRVLHINESHPLMTIARDDLWNNYCPGIVTQHPIFNTSLFKCSLNDRELSVFHDCSEPIFPGPDKPNYFSCTVDGTERAGFYIVPGLQLPNISNTCKAEVKVPVLLAALDDLHGPGNLTEVLNKGFEVCYDTESSFCSASACTLTGGICGSVCPAKETNIRKKVKIGIGAGFGGMGLMAMIFLIYLYSYRKKYAPSPLVSRNTSSDPSSKDDLEKADKLLGVHVFTYTELEEATNNFDSSRELGDGGFGTVYYGKLRDGRTVAVKRLYENNYRRVEQFMNEVEILTRLHHRNLVILYGCTSRHSRELLLVYEYISNGTVADHLHGDRSKPGAFPWATRLNIAVETASALMYLHASDIIHRDVKTNNILLDNNFCVKVADFGLSRLFPNHVTHVSTAPQGTPGYVDPEYHQCYQLTDKSDVFSFGVVLVELISSMPAVDITRHRHEINLSNLAINKIQNKALDELVDPTLGFESDYKVRKMIYAVAELAFQCLQGDKDMRPSMSTVLEILKDIQSDGYSKEKAEEFDISDDVELLKNGPPTPSPDSRISSKITLPTSD
ncbi:hypothetical protein ACOSQ2_026161 [Xanthoceras sorbifolium]